MLQELEQLEGEEAKEEAGQLPSTPKVPTSPGSCACACHLPSVLGVRTDPCPHNTDSSATIDNSSHRVLCSLDASRKMH